MIILIIKISGKQGYYFYFKALFLQCLEYISASLNFRTWFLNAITSLSYFLHRFSNMLFSAVKHFIRSILALSSFLHVQSCSWTFDSSRLSNFSCNARACLSFSRSSTSLLLSSSIFLISCFCNSWFLATSWALSGSIPSKILHLKIIASVLVNSVTHVLYQLLPVVCMKFCP